MAIRAIDLFAGLGGNSQGARMAGCQVVWAANHWPLAVQYHAANHPEAIHICQDLHQANWAEIPAHDVQMASPACQGHTPARGKEKPHHDAQRSTAWAPVSCAEVHRSPAVVIENVPEFLDWILYPAWLDAMTRLGYVVSPHFVDAADHGVPQHRERVFLICTRSKHPIKLNLPKRPHVPVRNVIEWDKHQWSPIHKPGRSEKTLDRIEAGRREFGDRFVFPYYSSGSGLKGRSLDRPLGTLTTRDRWAIVDGDRMRMVQPSEGLAIQSFPSDCLLPAVKRDAMHLIGNAVPPVVMADILVALGRAI